MAGRIVGIFSDLEHAENAVHDLTTAGFPKSAIALTTPDNVDHADALRSEATFTREGAVVGGVAFGIVGAAMAFSGMPLHPQVNIINSIPSPIFTTIWMGFAGWIAGGIIGLGVARNSGDALQPGSQAAVVVRAPNRIEEARAIFTYNDVLDVRGADPAELAARA